MQCTNKTDLFSFHENSDKKVRIRVNCHFFRCHKIFFHKNQKLNDTLLNKSHTCNEISTWITSIHVHENVKHKHRENIPSGLCNSSFTSWTVSIGGGGSLFLQRLTMTHVTFRRKVMGMEGLMKDRRGLTTPSDMT